MIPIAPHIANWALQRERAALADTEQPRAVIGDPPLPGAKPDERQEKEDERGGDERVFEFGGGGQPPPPPPPDYMAEAKAQDWAKQQQFDREQAKIAEQKAIDDAKKAEEDVAWGKRRTQAYNDAIGLGNRRLAQFGLDANDPYGLGSEYRARIDAANAGLDVGGDYTAAFSPNIFDEVSGTVRTGQRNKYRSAFNQASPASYGEDRFGSTADDVILASILGKQYDDAAADILASRNRGQITANVYDRALRDLGTAKGGANTELQGIGGTILSDIIGDIGTRQTQALDRAAAWDFGDTFDPSAEAGRISKYGDERLAGLRGEIEGAIGDRQFFDVPGLIGKASARVGNQTTGTAGDQEGVNQLLNTFEDQAQKQSEGSF